MLVNFLWKFRSAEISGDSSDNFLTSSNPFDTVTAADIDVTVENDGQQLQ